MNMKDLEIRMTPHTPEVVFKGNGVLSIKGISIPENTYAFYAEAMEWVKDLENNLPKQITLNLEFEYLNTASNRSMIDLIRTIEKYKQKNSALVINWIYVEQDEDALESGQDLEFCVETPFNYIPTLPED